VGTCGIGGVSAHGSCDVQSGLPLYSPELPDVAFGPLALPAGGNEEDISHMQHSGNCHRHVESPHVLS